ncbi:hypothetical protein [Methylophilus luteus]|uniref:MerC domain-containing protein n=1 Tax=Methylophilus luteus TaxID=640108 RepID=A0ABW3F473_9PROT
MKIDTIKNIMLVFILIQFVLNLQYAHTIYLLSSTGALALFPFLFWMIGSLSLYIAAIRLLLKRNSHGKLFILAAGLLLICTSSLLPFPPIYVFLVTLGALLGAAGWWVNKKYRKDLVHMK